VKVVEKKGAKTKGKKTRKTKQPAKKIQTSKKGEV